jgi:hypothetical protein
LTATAPRLKLLRSITWYSGAIKSVNQPKASALANYKLDGFSVDRLMTFLTALDQDVEIVIGRSRSRGRSRGYRW